MPVSTIAEFAVPLSREQAEGMEQRRMKKHDVAIVLLHWFNAVVWLMELITGVALIVAPAYRIAPLWYEHMIAGAFGSRANILRFHIALGVTWIVVFAVYATFGNRHYLRAAVLKNEVSLDEDDVQWLRVRVLRLLGRTRRPLPPQGAYNAGQKLFALSVYTLLPVIMLTGLIMSFHWFGSQAVAWAMAMHFLAVGLVVSGLMIHVYMGAVFPEERPAFYSMITGTVDELYAYRHHFKWWREVKLQDNRSDEELQVEPAADRDPHGEAYLVHATQTGNLPELSAASPPEFESFSATQITDICYPEEL